MLDEHQQRPASISLAPPTIVLASGCVGILLAFGLCGMHDLGQTLGTFALFLLGISALAIVVSIPWLIVVLILKITRE